MSPTPQDIAPSGICRTFRHQQPALASGKRNMETTKSKVTWDQRKTEMWYDAVKRTRQILVPVQVFASRSLPSFGGALQVSLH